MHKNNIRKSTSSLHKIKTPQHLLRLKDEQDEFHNESNSHFQLPSLSRQKSWKDNDNFLPNENSTTTSISWSQEAEDVATQKLEEQWMIVEKSFYDEDNQLPQGSVLDECIQWRIQVPYLRIIGRNPTCSTNSTQIYDPVVSSSNKKMIKFDKLQNDEKEDSTPYKLNKAKFEDVLDMLMEHIISELFPNKENDEDSLCENFTNVLKVAPATVHANKNSSKCAKINWAEEAISPNYIENKSLSIRNRLLDTENFLQTKNDTNYQEVQKKQRNSVSANKPRDFNDIDDDVLRSKNRLCTPHIGRNRLGTIFNEKIVVSPVPFAVSTRESFSTLKTIPIKFMGDNLEIPSFQGSARNISDFRSSARKSSLRNSDIRSAWQAPVCPTVWPKNIRLAPIDASRLPNSKNRLLATQSPTILHCSRKSLSPISRSTIPKSAHTTRDRNDVLEIEGKHIMLAQSSKISLLSAGWDNNSRVVKSKKKKIRTKEGP